MITKLVAKYLYRKMVSSAKQKAGMTVYHGPWLGILLEPHPSLGGPESEFPLPILEFRKIPSEKCQKKNRVPVEKSESEFPISEFLYVSRN